MATNWFVVVGLLLILIGLTDTWRRELPVTAAAIYLIAGLLLGPEFAGFIDLGLARDAPLLEHLTEVALLISLFAVGLRLRAPLADPIWRAPLVMATVTMLATVALLCAAGLTLGLAIGPALLLAAALAPTDPVLASDVQVDHERDRDRLRFSLSAEAGLNDGTALPLVLLALGLMGLHELGAGGWRWGLVDLLWGAAGGLAMGWALGFAFSRFVVWLRREREQALGMESFLTLGLIALTYGIALLLQVGGFLAVFAAGLAMRQVERRELPAEDAAYMAKAVLDFTLDLEKLAELVVMIVVGALLTREAFTAQTIGVALVVFFVVRPLAGRLRDDLAARAGPLTAPPGRLVRHPGRGLDVLPGLRRGAWRGGAAAGLGGRRGAGDDHAVGADARHHGHAGDALVPALALPPAAAGGVRPACVTRARKLPQGPRPFPPSNRSTS